MNTLGNEFKVFLPNDTPVLIDSGAEIKKECKNKSAYANRIKEKNTHKKRFVLIKKISKVKTMNNKFPRIIIDDELYDSVSGLKFHTKNIVTTFDTSKNGLENLSKMSDEKLASWLPFRTDKNIAIFFKFFDEKKSGEVIKHDLHPEAASELLPTDSRESRADFPFGFLLVKRELLEWQSKQVEIAERSPCFTLRLKKSILLPVQDMLWHFTDTQRD